MKTANLVYITSTPGTPENMSPATALWEPGQPAPPWIYEYQYPVDCLKACRVIPAYQTGYAGSVPITTAVTGSAPIVTTPPVRFVVATDEFRPVTAAAVVAGGTGYVVGDEITLPYGDNTDPPIGAPVKLRVATVSGTTILTVSVVNQVLGSSPSLGGSYFEVQSGTIAQDETTGSGTGATFTLTQSAKAAQRVILTNQEFATLAYVADVTDPNLWDPEFQNALAALLGANLAIALSGDKTIANMAIGLANEAIEQARKDDGNEALTVNDVTPDFIRVRGWGNPEWVSGPFSNNDWGGLFPAFI